MNTTKYKVLKAVYDKNQPSVTDILEEVGTTRPNINKHLEDLEEKGLISVTKTRHKHIREITDTGEKKLLDQDLDQTEVNSSGSQVDPYFVHFFAINCEFNNPDQLPEDWRERFKEFEDLEMEEHPDFDRIQVKTKKWVYRLTGRSIEVKLREELSGNDVKTLKDRAWDKAIEGLEYLENKIGQDIPRDRLQLRIQTQHIGARRRHLTKAFIDHIDQNTILDARKYRVLDENDEIRIYCDASGPGGMLEGEAGNGGQVNGRMDTAEDDMELLQEHTWNLLDDPENTRRLVDSPERLDKVEKDIQEMEEAISGLSGAVKKGMEEVTSTVKANNPDTNQIQSQVMEMKSRQEELVQELTSIQDQVRNLVEVTEQNVAVQSSRSQADERIIEKLDEISEKVGQESQSDEDWTVNPLADQVEISNKWIHRGIGPDHLMAYSPEIEKQFILIREEDLS